MAKIKVQVTIDEELLNRVDTYADDNYTSRSGVITMAANQFLLTHEATKALVDVAVSLRRCADLGQVDDETMRQLEAFNTVAQMMLGK